MAYIFTCITMIPHCSNSVLFPNSQPPSFLSLSAMDFFKTCLAVITWRVADSAFDHQGETNPPWKSLLPKTTSASLDVAKEVLQTRARPPEEGGVMSCPARCSAPSPGKVIEKQAKPSDTNSKVAIFGNLPDKG